MFVQDTWRPRDRLTLTLGLRYDVEIPYTERQNQVAYGFDQSAALPVQVPGLTLTGGLQFAGVDGHPRTEGRVDRNNVGPRAGFAYELFKRTVIRGGYGLFYSPMGEILTNLGGVATFSSTTPYIGTGNGSARTSSKSFGQDRRRSALGAGVRQPELPQSNRVSLTSSGR